jgi:hypothetical protein
VFKLFHFSEHAVTIFRVSVRRKGEADQYICLGVAVVVRGGGCGRVNRRG